MDIEMLKALYDFQAVYPKTISFDEGEYFILYQTSARQRNWWQVVSMKGNIGFVPSNYVMKIKVEPEFLISFLNSSIECLEKSTQNEINGIMAKDELLERLREKKIAMEKLYLDSTERDCDSSLSFSQSIGEKSHSHSRSHADSLSSSHKAHSHQNKSGRHHSPQSKRLEMGKKSLSSPSVGALPQMLHESPSMGSIQVQTQQSQQQQMAQQQQQQQQPQAQPAAAPSQGKANDVAQDNSITSETTSETTTTTTTTSEDVVTTYRDPGRGENETSAIKQKHLKSASLRGDGDVPMTNGQAGDSAKGKDRHETGEPPYDGCTMAGGKATDGQHSGENSQALDSEGSATKNANTEKCGPTAMESNQTKLHVVSSDVYQIVDVIRRNTNLSFDMSCEALRTVLTSLEQLYNGAINPYLEAVAVHVTEKVETPKELLGITHDSKRLQYIFSQLADCKNDSEQRTWMLYEDEDDIVMFLEELVEILNNADENISCYAMSCDQYQALVNLVQYYQMETRWAIKTLLLKTFTAACRLDHIIVDILLTSVLPLEIVEDMKTNFANLDKFKQLVKMLTVIFSLGQPMPVNHQDFLGVHFASFLLEIIEGNNPEVLVDLVIALVLAFNLQFTNEATNVVVEAMQSLPTAKVFTEKILLLLNREEDPIKLLKHSTQNVNSVLKMFTDMFSNTETAGMFYTNDIKVLIDIMVRQLSDLCAGNPLRRCYLELCRRILRNTDYTEHQHRKQDLMKIFTRIFCEETECSASDQKLVREIANEFPHLFKA